MSYFSTIWNVHRPSITVLPINVSSRPAAMALWPEARISSARSPRASYDFPVRQRIPKTSALHTGDSNWGKPYFIQACGSHVWAARATDTISLQDAQIGIESART